MTSMPTIFRGQSHSFHLPLNTVEERQPVYRVELQKEASIQRKQNVFKMILPKPPPKYGPQYYVTLYKNTPLSAFAQFSFKLRYQLHSENAYKMLTASILFPIACARETAKFRLINII